MSNLNEKNLKNDNKNTNENLKVMVLASDVFDVKGNLIMAKGSMISSVTYVKLREMGIKEIYVRKKLENEPLKLEELPIKHNDNLTIKNNNDFIQFESSYKIQTDKLKNTLNEIGKGQEIEINKLYRLTNNLLENIKYKSEIFTYLGFIETNDESTFSHSNNVGLLCNVFAKWLNFSDEEIKFVTTAGLLHDIGKTKIPPEILNKPSRLTSDEMSIIQKHPTYGYEMIETQKIPGDIKLGCLMHHEKIDGSGYPLKLKDENINRYAKIIAICDIYDAMTANRSYRQKISPFDVIKNFERSSYGKLDTKYLLVFLQNIAYNYLNNQVELSNGDIGEIVFINKNNLSCPFVKVFDQVIDLSQRKDLDIIRLV